MAGTGGTTGISRRGFLAGAAAVVAASRLAQANGLLAAAADVTIPSDPFTLGIASGDPTADGFVLWTRLAPDPLNDGGMPPDDVPVTWEVSDDDAFTAVVATGVEPAVAALAHSVHVEVAGLDPDRWYHYRFQAAGWTSPVGRARTTPDAGSRSPLRLGAASCQNWKDGYYTAHAHLAQESCDLVAWLGDYIYESGVNGTVRDHNSSEVATLAAYRNRYALYKGDPNLQAAHAACPWVVIWDDHEVDNNYAGDVAADGTDTATFLARRAAAYQAWYEHQPVRLPVPTGADYDIYRRVTWGNLATVHLLDTRQHRSDQACGDSLQLPCADVSDASRTLLGAGQETWLLDGLAVSPTVWDVLTQQIVFAPMPIGKQFNMDQWDGYVPQRDRVWAGLRQVPNPVVLSGDIHFGAMVHLHDTLGDTTTDRVGTELVVGSISSRWTSSAPGAVKFVLEKLAWWEFVNAADRGYTIVDFTETHLHAELRVVSTTTATTATVRTAHALDVDAVPVDPPPTTTTTTSSTTTTTEPTTTTSTSTTSTSSTSTSSTSSTTSTSTSTTSTSTSTSTLVENAGNGANAGATSSTTVTGTAGTTGGATVASPVSAAPTFAG